MDNTTDTPVLGKKGTFPATVARVLDNYKLVINRGSENGIREGQRMLVYCVSDEDIKDPHTGESLGYLELVKGTGKIIFVQEKMSILESDKIFKSSKTNPYPSITHSWQQLDFLVLEGKLVPFENPEVGDMVKPI